MRILFVNAVNKNDFSYNVPLSFAYLSGYLKNKMNTNGLYVKSISTPDIDRIERTIFNYKPNVVGISSTTPTFDKAIKISKLIKKICKDIVVVVGGQHISLLPESLSDAMDFGVLGEGEQTFLELLESINRKNKEYQDIAGLCFWSEGKLVNTKRRPHIKNLDNVSHPIRDLLNPTNNTLFSSRGCPYDCVFCSSSVMWDRKIRFHSAEYVFQEIYGLYKKGHSVQWFADDLFICNEERIKKIVDLIKENGLYKKIIFFAESRSNLITNSITSLIKELNILRISFGFESADDNVLKYAKGDSVTAEKHINASEICRKYGILVDGYFMTGFPLDNHETMRKTYEFAKNYCDTAGRLNLVMVFPRTYLKESLFNETGIDFSRVHLEKFKRNSYLPVEDETVFCNNLTKDEIIDYIEKFNKLSKKKNMKFYTIFAKRLIFSKSFFMNIKFLMRNSLLRLNNPKREFESEVIRLK